MNPELKINHYSIKLYWEGLVWVHIKRNELVAYHSWSDGNNHLSIEFVTKTNCFKIECDSKEKWEAILKELDNKI